MKQERMPARTFVKEPKERYSPLRTRIPTQPDPRAVMLRCFEKLRARLRGEIID